MLGTGTQRALLRRWTSPATHPHERMAGLLALLHAAFSAQIRGLTITGINDQQRTLALARRPFPGPVDPATWAAVQARLDTQYQTATGRLGRSDMGGRMNTGCPGFMSFLLVYVAYFAVGLWAQPL